MPPSIATLPLRLSVRSARVMLRAARDAAELGLSALDLIGLVLGDAPAARYAEPEARGWNPDVTADATEPVAPVTVDYEPAVDEVPAVEVVEAFDPVVEAFDPVVEAFDPVVEAFDPVVDVVEHVSAEAVLVEEFAEPGAEQGAGAAVRIEPPFPGFDGLRATEVIARLRGADDAELAETELYERTHRARGTVLTALARESKRRGPG